MPFRPATPGDLPWMMELASQIDDFFFAERLPRALHDPQCRVFVAENGGRGAAFAEMEFPWQGHAWLQWMRVAPEFQNAGLGTAFTGFLVDRARLLGAQNVGLTTMEHNVRVHRIMGGLGFVHRLTEWSSEAADIPVPSGGTGNPMAISPHELPRFLATLSEHAAGIVVRHPGLEECFADARLLPWSELSATGRVWGVRQGETFVGGALLYEYYRKRWTSFILPLCGSPDALMALAALGFRLHGLRRAERITLSLPASLFGQLHPEGVGLNHGVRVYMKTF